MTAREQLKQFYELQKRIQDCLDAEAKQQQEQEKHKALQQWLDWQIQYGYGTNADILRGLTIDALAQEGVVLDWSFPRKRPLLAIGPCPSCGHQQYKLVENLFDLARALFSDTKPPVCEVCSLSQAKTQEAASWQAKLAEAIRDAINEMLSAQETS